jgi:exodeoxyribonuclease V alpha subunit
MNNVSESLMVLREEELLQDIDLELIRFIKSYEPELSREVQLAICLVSYLFREGDVCLSLEEYAGKELFPESENDSIIAPTLEKWKQALTESTQVGKPGEFKPFILDDAGRFYMHKLWYYERALADNLLKRSDLVYNIDTDWLDSRMKRLFPDSTEKVDWQKIAAASALRHQLAVISGGPGTGKTSTVVRILALLLEYAQKEEQREFSIALTAPTGKAAAKLNESIVAAKATLDTSEKIRSSIPEETFTLHQLLGARRNSSSFKRNEENPIPYDVVVVDEASMVDQSLMSKLTSALLPDARLILLGDKDQLASVEAGSVLGDICALNANNLSDKFSQWLKKISINVPSTVINANSTSLTDNIVLLTKSYRFSADSGIAKLSNNINEGDSKTSLKLLKDPKYGDIELISLKDQTVLKKYLKPKVVKYVQAIQKSTSKQGALQNLGKFQILSAHRRGPGGVYRVNRLVEHMLQEEHLISKYAEWYQGRPVMITVNDYTLDLYNGDIGVCLMDKQNKPKVYFGDRNEIRSFPPARLPEHETAYALTVHKSQGSEYDDVLLILPNKFSKVMSRELLYTAVTRTRTTIAILGREAIAKQAIEHKIHRSSGLRDYFWRK